METDPDRRERYLRTWLRARSAELNADLRDARLDFAAGDARRQAAEAGAREELQCIRRAIDDLDAATPRPDA